MAAWSKGQGVAVMHVRAEADGWRVCKAGQRNSRNRILIASEGRKEDVDACRVHAGNSPGAQNAPNADVKGLGEKI